MANVKFFAYNVGKEGRRNVFCTCTTCDYLQLATATYSHSAGYGMSGVYLQIL